MERTLSVYNYLARVRVAGWDAALSRIRALEREVDHLRSLPDAIAMLDMRIARLENADSDSSFGMVEEYAQLLTQVRRRYHDFYVRQLSFKAKYQVGAMNNGLLVHNTNFVLPGESVSENDIYHLVTILPPGLVTTLRVLHDPTELENDYVSRECYYYTPPSWAKDKEVRVKNYERAEPFTSEFQISNEEFVYTLLIVAPDPPNFGKILYCVKYNPLQDLLVADQAPVRHKPFQIRDLKIIPGSDVPFILTTNTMFSFYPGDEILTPISYLSYSLHAVQTHFIKQVDISLSLLPPIAPNANPIYEVARMTRMAINNIASIAHDLSLNAVRAISLNLPYISAHLTSPEVAISPLLVDREVTTLGQEFIHQPSNVYYQNGTANQKIGMVEPSDISRVQVFYGSDSPEMMSTGLTFTYSLFTKQDDNTVADSRTFIDVDYYGNNVWTVESDFQAETYFYLRITINGYTTPGGTVDATSCVVKVLTTEEGREDEEIVRTLTFETTVDSDGSFSTTGVAKLNSTSVKMEDVKTFSGDRTVIDIGYMMCEVEEKDGDWGNAYHYVYVKSFSSTSDLLSFCKSRHFEVQMLSSPTITYIRAPMVVYNTLMWSTEEEMYTAIIHLLIKTTVLDLRMDELEYRLDAFIEMMKPTLLGTVGGALSTFALFAGPLKIAVTMERMATVLFTAEALMQGRYFHAIGAATGAATAFWLSRAKGSVSALRRLDIPGFVHRALLQTKRLVKRKEEAINGRAPFEVFSHNDNVVALLGTPIEQLPGSKYVTEALNNYPEGSPGYTLVKMAKDMGYTPEHHTLMVQNSFAIKDSNGEVRDVTYSGRVGIGEGAMPHIHDFNVASINVRDQISGPGHMFTYTHKEGDDLITIKFSEDGNAQEELIERKAALCMLGHDVEKVRDMAPTDLIDLDDRSIRELLESVTAKTMKSNMRVIEHTPMFYDPEHLLNITKFVSSSVFRNNFRYSIPDRTCQPFAKAMFERLTSNDSELLARLFPEVDQDFNIFGADRYFHDNSDPEYYRFVDLKALVFEAYEALLMPPTF